METPNKPQFVVEGLFPLPLYKTNIGRKFTKEEQDEIDIIVNEGVKENPRNTIPNRSTFSTDTYLLNGTHKPLLPLQTFIEEHINQFVSNVLGIDTSKVFCNITQAWMVVNKPQQFQPPHFHQNSIISGVFYIKCLKGEKRTEDSFTTDKGNFEAPFEGGDGIVFTKDDNAMFKTIHPPLGHPTPFNCQSVNIEIDNGDLVLFPSYVKHSVNRNETSDQIRISLAFNTFLFGTLGNNISLTEMNLKQGRISNEN